MKIVRTFLISLIFLSNLCFAQNTIDNAIKVFATSSGLEYASVSFQVIDLESNSPISILNPKLSLPTASTAKLFSTATALDILGPEYKAKTRIYIDGLIDSNGVLNGNLWIRGGGDPSIGSKYFNKEGKQLAFMKVWVDTLKALGIKSISGSVIADASEFGYAGSPDGWNWSDLGNYYGAGPSGLTISDNLVRYTFSMANVGKKSVVTSISPYIPGLVFHNYVIASKRSGDHAYIYGAPYSLDRFVTGTLPANRSSFLVKGSIPDPEFQFAFELNNILMDNEVNVSGNPKSVRRLEIDSNPINYNHRELIYTHTGTSLIEIINQTNSRSINLFAEHMISLIGYEKTKNGSHEKGLNVLKNHWNSRIDINGLYITDGSGLSRSNAISAHHFTQLLKYMSTSKYASQFNKSLPIAGVSGTMRNVCKGQSGQNRIAAKSGSMSRIKSYAGYATTKEGKKLAFALIVNNATCSSSALKKKMEVLFNKIVSYNPI